MKEFEVCKYYDKSKRMDFLEKSKMCHLSKTINRQLNCDTVLVKERNGRETN